MASAFESKTLYAAVASTGYRMTFSFAHAYAQGMSRGGTFWVKQYGPTATVSGSVPTSPIPSAGTIADGWLRIGDGESFAFGSPDLDITSRRGNEKDTSVAVIDIWCEVTGDLVVVSQ